MTPVMPSYKQLGCRWVLVLAVWAGCWGHAPASRASGVKGTVGIGILCQDPDTGRKLWRPRHADTWHEKHQLQLFKACVARNFFQAQGRTAMGIAPDAQRSHRLAELVDAHAEVLKLMDYIQALESGVSDETLLEFFPKGVKGPTVTGCEKTREPQLGYLR